MSESKTSVQAECLEKSVSEPDEIILKGLRAGRFDAYTKLYDGYALRIFRFAVVRLGGDNLAAEDIVVETLIDVIKNIRKFDSRKATFSTWITGISHRKINDELRKRMRRKAIPYCGVVGMDALKEIPDGKDLAQGVSARLDAQRKIVELVEILSDVEMEALVLQSVSGFSLREISQVIGKSERAVHSILHRAKQKAQERLGREDE